MVYGEHLTRCLKCGKPFICGDCIETVCFDCKHNTKPVEQEIFGEINNQPKTCGTCAGFARTQHGSGACCAPLPMWCSGHHWVYEDDNAEECEVYVCAKTADKNP
jgi:hypothetical protein